jgi:isopenicillin N synthase-like dioxygenase
MGSESGSHRLEVKEAFSYGFAWPSDRQSTNSLNGPNIWPDTWPTNDTNDVSHGEDTRIAHWRDHLERFYASMTLAAEGVVRGLSLALGLDEHYLSRYNEHGAEISLMRLFHYWPYSTAGPQTDNVHSHDHKTVLIFS